MPRIKPQELEALIKRSLLDFYKARRQSLNGLKLKHTLRRKNPYLFRAIGTQSGSEIVQGLLAAHISSSDETIFGNIFFEPIAKCVSGGTVSPSPGVDIQIERERVITAISVKSGPNWANSSQIKRQKQDFEELRRRLRKTQKQFDPVLGYGYGRKNTDPKKEKPYRERSGQAFWEELTGDPDFYLRLIRLMKNYPREHREMYEVEWDKAVNRFEREFLNDFSTRAGEIDWEKLVEFICSKDKLFKGHSVHPKEVPDV